MVKTISGSLNLKPLIDIGNPDAPQGSEPWCRSFHQTICRLKREGQFAVSNLKYSLHDFRDGNHYTRLTDAQGRSFKTWDKFVQCREPYGLGMRIDVADAIMNEKDDGKLLRDVLGKHGANQHTVGGDSITSLSEATGRGTSRVYILARLERDGHDDLAARVRAGEMSANAAAIEAGFRKHPTPLNQAQKLLSKMTRPDRRVIWQQLNEEFQRN